MPDQQPPAGPGVLSAILPILAGVASAATPGLARGVQAGLGTAGAMDERYRLKQALDEAKAQRENALQNFGRLMDYSSRSVENPPVPFQSPEMAEDEAGSDRIRGFLREQGLPEKPAIDQEHAAFLKALAPLDLHSALAQYQTLATRERQPRMKDVLGMAPLRAGQKLTGKTSEGFGFELTGEKPANATFRTEVRKGYKWDVGVDPHSGQELFARNTGEQFVQPQPADYIDKVVTTDSKTGNQTLVGFDKRLGPQKGLRYTFSIGGRDRASFSRLLGLRSKGQSTGDPQVDSLSQSDAADLFRNQGLLGFLLGGAESGGAPPAVTPVTPVTPTPGGSADERLKKKLGMK